MEFLSKFWCNLDKGSFEKQFRSKGEIRKSANGGLQLKNKMEWGQIRKFPYCYSPALQYPSLSAAQNSKMVMVLPCDENPHIIYRWKEHGEENTMR
jgi:hypothetical protein